MKNLQKTLMILCVMGLMISCGGGSGNTPESVAEKFVEALYKGDLDGMKKISSKEQTTEMSADDKGSKAMLALFKEAGKDASGFKAVETNLSEDGNSGTVKVGVTSKDGKTDTMKVKVIKEDGKWAVNGMDLK